MNSLDKIHGMVVGDKLQRIGDAVDQILLTNHGWHGLSLIKNFANCNRQKKAGPSTCSRFAFSIYQPAGAKPSCCLTCSRSRLSERRYASIAAIASSLV